MEPFTQIGGTFLFIIVTSIIGAVIMFKISNGFTAQERGMWKVLYHIKDVLYTIIGAILGARSGIVILDLIRLLS